MYSASDLIPAVKRAAMEAVEQQKPCGIFYGTVVSAAPLSIRVSQKLTLGPAQLELGSAVRDFTVMATVAHETEEGQGPGKHKHGYAGTKAFTVHLGLSAGEKVALLRRQGGQKYLVLDRVRGDAG